MRAERYNHERADHIVNRRTVSDGNVCNSGHAFGNLSRSLAANECKHEFNATVFEWLSLDAIAEKRFDFLWGNELLEFSPHPPLFEKCANHRRVRGWLTRSSRLI